MSQMFLWVLGGTCDRVKCCCEYLVLAICRESADHTILFLPLLAQLLVQRCDSFTTKRL